MWSFPFEKTYRDLIREETRLRSECDPSVNAGNNTPCYIFRELTTVDRIDGTTVSVQKCTLRNTLCKTHSKEHRFRARSRLRKQFRVRFDGPSGTPRR